MSFSHNISSFEWLLWKNNLLALVFSVLLQDNNLFFNVEGINFHEKNFVV